MKKSHNIDEKYLDKIISVAYGDAGLFDKLEVFVRAKRSPEVEKLLKEYMQTADAVHLMGKEECPAETVRSAEKITGGRISLRRNTLVRTAGLLLMRPAMSAAAAVVILSIAALVIFRQPKEEQKYSKAEVENAELQVKESLSLIGKVFKKTQYRLADEVLGKQVAAPLQKSIEAVNDLLKGG